MSTFLVHEELIKFFKQLNLLTITGIVVTKDHKFLNISFLNIECLAFNFDLFLSY